MIHAKPDRAPGAANLAYLASTMAMSGGGGPDPRSHHSGAAAAAINISFACGGGHDADTETGDGVALLAANALLTGQSREIANDDWDAMFRAVESRLRQTVGERLAVMPELQPHHAAGRVQAIVLECVEALEQLHTALMLERDRCGQLERELALLTGSAARPLL
jgi:hypothetical protein